MQRVGNNSVWSNIAQAAQKESVHGLHVVHHIWLLRSNSINDAIAIITFDQSDLSEIYESKTFKVSC